MGRIILTIAGSTEKPPAFNTELRAEVKGPDAEFAEDFIFVGRRAQVIEDADVARIRKHRWLLHVGVQFEGVSRDWAQQAVEFVVGLSEEELAGVFVETSCKAFSPRALKDFDPKDAHNLFHFFVEIMGDQSYMTTDGMFAFGLPEVRAPYSQLNRESAQAAVIGLAARMVCEGHQPVDGGYFRASESAPLYEVSRQPEATSPGDDVYSNPLPPWQLDLSA